MVSTIAPRRGEIKTADEDKKRTSGRKILKIPELDNAFGRRTEGKSRVIRRGSQVEGRFSGVWVSFCCFLAKLGDKINKR